MPHAKYWWHWIYTRKLKISRSSTSLTYTWFRLKFTVSVILWISICVCPLWVQAKGNLLSLRSGQHKIIFFGGGRQYKYKYYGQAHIHQKNNLNSINDALYPKYEYKYIFSRPGRSQGLLYKHLRHWLIHSVGPWAFSSHSFSAMPRPNGLHSSLSLSLSD